jgi:hypothetical protein
VARHLLELYIQRATTTPAFKQTTSSRPATLPEDRRFPDQPFCSWTASPRRESPLRAAPAESRRCLPEEPVVAQHSRHDHTVTSVRAFGLLCYLVFNAYTATWSSFLRAFGFAMHSALFRATAFLHFSGLLAFSLGRSSHRGSPPASHRLPSDSWPSPRPEWPQPGTPTFNTLVAFT